MKLLVITIARKPLSEGSVARNVLKHGTGGLNIDGCRIGNDRTKRTQNPQHNTNLNPGVWQGGVTGSNSGRWPANVILQHKPECRLVSSKRVVRDQPVRGSSDEEGTETVDAWGCAPGCPVPDLDQQSGACPSTMHGRLPPDSIVPNPGQCAPGMFGVGREVGNVYADSGGASRFFKQVKDADL